MDANMDGIAALGDDSQLVAPEYAEYRNLYHSKWLMEIGLESSVIAVNLLCFVLSLFYCPKLVHIILTCKVVTLTFNSLISIYAAKTMYALEDPSNIGLIESTDPDEFAVGNDSEQVVYALDGALFFLSQCYTFVLLRELHLITCEMTPRQPSTVTILAKCGLAFIIGVLLVATDHLIPIHAMANTTTAHIVSAVTPITTFAVLVLTLLDAGLVYRILVALRKNDHFRRQCRGQKNGSLGFLVGVVVWLMASQVTRLALHLVRVVVHPQSLVGFSDCVESEIGVLACGERYEQSLVQIKTYFRETLFYAIEHVIFCFVMIYKQIREKQRVE